MLKNILILIIIGYLALSLIAHFLANKLIFIPPKAGYEDSDNIIKLKTAYGEIISARYLKNPKAKYTILVSHGNAEDIGYMEPFLEEMEKHGFSVFAYDYQGYGTNQGTPSESHSYMDIDAAYDYLVDKLKIPPQNIVLYGRSLGSAVALDLAIRKPAKAIIMEAPFVTSFRVLTVSPILPFDKFNNLAKIKKLTMPLLIIHGMHDTIVPFWHGEKLYNAAKSRKQSFWVPNANHNDILWQAGDKYWQVISKFINE